MRYLSRVSVIATVDGGQHIGEPDRSIDTDGKQCTAVDGGSSKTYLSHLKKGPPKCTPFRIFSPLYLAVRQLFPARN